ncbi:hypothetical protein CRG98_027121 [Punica granatum]|uniref:Uncharacterized protein n=1 Tax=Punica granatum TaxID=22663 RepID=A0A2I0J8J3_PUNGR|nr:hypothetical protein CRG98_027121 [Punica granatum]
MRSNVVEDKGRACITGVARQTPYLRRLVLNSSSLAVRMRGNFDPKETNGGNTFIIEKEYNSDWIPNSGRVESVGFLMGGPKKSTVPFDKSSRSSTELCESLQPPTTFSRLSVSRACGRITEALPPGSAIPMRMINQQLSVAAAAATWPNICTDDNGHCRSATCILMRVLEWIGEMGKTRRS